MRSISTRLNTSDQVSSPAMRMPARSAASARAAAWPRSRVDGGKQVDAGEALEGIGHA